MQQILLTVFTPTYNRAYCLHRLYDSLCQQRRSDFEWLIVDDGSTDETTKVVNGFISENKINIRYIEKQNGGKHTAINIGVRAAKGELFYIVDSDDFVPNGAIGFIICKSQKILHDGTFAGISGCDRTCDGLVMSNITDKIISNSLEIRYKYNIVGDLAEVFKTSVLMKYKFPEFLNEKFCPEALVWNRIAADGLKIAYYSDIIKIIEYMPDGLTAGIVKARMQSPTLTTICYSEMLTNPHVPIRQKIKAAINYWRFWLCKKDLIVTLSKRWMWLFPLGVVMHFKDLRNCK